MTITMEVTSAPEWDERILYTPPRAGTCPFEKAMSPDIILGIVEFLEAPQCLTLSQTCKRIYLLSQQRRGYWAKCAFTHGLLLPVPREYYTTEQLRALAVKQANLEYDWDVQAPKIKRQTKMHHDWSGQEYLVPSGSRWLVQYGSGDDGSKLVIWDIVRNRKVGNMVALHTTAEVGCIAGDSLAPNEIVLACSCTGQTSVIVLNFLFSEDVQTGSTEYTLERRDIDYGRLVHGCTIKGDILVLTGTDSMDVQRWRDDGSRRSAPLDTRIRRGPCQIVENYLINAYTILIEPNVVNSILGVYDISSVLQPDESARSRRQPISYEQGEDEDEEMKINEDALIHCATSDIREICSIQLYGEPVGGPSFVSHSLEKVANGRTQINFRILHTINTTEGHNLYYTDYTLPYLDPTKDSSTPSRHDWGPNVHNGESGEISLQTDGPRIIDLDPSHRPPCYTPTGAIRWQRFVQGASASRILWETKMGVFRMHSDWTDNASCSRPLQAISRPGRVISVLAFDEAMGFMIIEGETDHDIVLWIR